MSKGISIFAILRRTCNEFERNKNGSIFFRQLFGKSEVSGSAFPFFCFFFFRWNLSSVVCWRPMIGGRGRANQLTGRWATWSISGDRPPRLETNNSTSDVPWFRFVFFCPVTNEDPILKATRKPRNLPRFFILSLSRDSPRSVGRPADRTAVQRKSSAARWLTGNVDCVYQTGTISSEKKKLWAKFLFPSWMARLVKNHRNSPISGKFVENSRSQEPA